jgi:hypothetical protein
MAISFKGAQYPKSVILFAVFFYVRYGRWCTGRFSRGIRFFMPISLGIRLTAEKIRPSGFNAAVENRAADGRFGLLRSKSPRPQPGADDCLVASHPVFD